MKFCTLIKTSNTLHGLSKHAYNKFNMSGGRHFENIEKSPYLRNGLTDFHEILHNDTHWPCQLKKFKSKMADSRHFEKKTLDRHNSATVRQITMKFGMITQCDLLNLIGGQNFECLKQHGGRPPFLQIEKNHHSCATV